MDLIQKLKIKPTLEKKITFEVNIRKAAIKVPKKTLKREPGKKDPEKEIPEQKSIIIQKGFIIDRTDEGFNREQFLNLFKGKKKVKSIVASPKKKKSTKIPEPQKISLTKVVFRIIKKLDKKVKLQSKKTLRKPRKPRKLRKAKDQKEEPIPEGMVSITEFEDRLWEKPSPIKLKYSSFYLNNREIFINFINSFYSNYKKEISDKENITCEDIAKSKRKG